MTNNPWLGTYEPAPTPLETNVTALDDPYLQRPTFAAAPEAQHAALLEDALFQVKRVVVGQDRLVERVMVCLLANGHCLIEGFPGLAKTLTVSTLSQVVGGKFSRAPVHPRPGARRPRGHPHLAPVDGGLRRSSGARSSPTSCSPTRSTAPPPRCSRRCSRRWPSVRSRSAATTRQLPAPFLVLATQNPIESEGVYALPEAQRDRFLMHVVVPQPTYEEEIGDRPPHEPRNAAAGRAGADPRAARRAAGRRRDVFVHHAVQDYAVRLVMATREPARWGLEDLDRLHRPRRQPPRHPGSADRSARALAVLRGRRFVVPQDVYDVAPEVLRHRITLDVRRAGRGRAPRRRRASRARPRAGAADRAPAGRGHRATMPVGFDAAARRRPPDDRRTAGRARPRSPRSPARRGAAPPRARGPAPAGRQRVRRPPDGRATGRAASARAPDRTSPATTRGSSTGTSRPAPRRSRTSGTTEAEREVDTWIVADRSASLDFGTARAEKRDVVLGVTAAFGMLTVRGHNRLGVLVAGTERLQHLPAPKRAHRGSWRRSASSTTRRGRTGAPGTRRRPGGGAAPPARDPAAPQPGRRGLRLPRVDDGWQQPLLALARSPPGHRGARHRPARARAARGRDPRRGRHRDRAASATSRRASHGARASATRRPRRERHARDRSRRSRRAGAEYLHLSTDARLAHRHAAVRHPAHAPAARRAPRRSATPSAHASRPCGEPDDLPVRVAARCCWCCPPRCSSAYLLVQRRRHTQVLRFTSVDLLDSVAPARQGWQRHVPAAAILLALVVLTLAFAQPAMAMRTPRGPRDDHAHPRHVRVDDRDRRRAEPAGRPLRTRPRSSSRTCPRASRSAWSPSTAAPGCWCRRPPTPAPVLDALELARRSAAGPRPRPASATSLVGDRRACPRATSDKPAPGGDRPDERRLPDDRRRRRCRRRTPPTPRRRTRRAQSVADRHDRVRHLRRHRRASSGQDVPVPYDPRGHGADRLGERRAVVHRRDQRASSARSTTRSAATSPTSCRRGS